ncbi:MAG TPA: DUF4149 domain-containing protein [Gemmatimonadaceae bacterium]|nr:DUF4149 domain-containing protein [Gemmatimonadaceae bacterium]
MASMLLLSLWLGGALYFASVVAPAAFRVLLAPGGAGALVRHTLPQLFVAGIGTGIAAVLAGVLWRQSRPLVGAAGLLAISCAVGQFVIGARLERVRQAIGGPVGALAPGNPLRIEFGRLHGWSVAALGVAMLAAAAGVVAAWLWRGGGDDGSRRAASGADHAASAEPAR